MKNLPILTLLLILALPAVAQTPSKQIARYEIDARLKLDERSHPSIIEGRELLTWLNDSLDPIPELQFHLYLNAFKNQRSTFFRESGGQLRGDRFAPGEWGWIDIKELKIAGGEDLTSRIEFIQPDDGNKDDRTVIRVPLSRPLRPSEIITLEIVFESRLPRVFARTGYWSSFAMVGQWFPKIGVWESAGERRRETAGWNCHQFHANSEFYADFGAYDVRITVPAAYKDKIGATGELRSETSNQDGTVTYNFYQADVHDFAWTVDTSYVKVTRPFKADEWVKPEEIGEWSRRLGLPPEQVWLKDIDVTLLIQPEHQAQIDRHFRAAFNAIKYFGLWYGAYPYQTLTIVDPPYNADGAEGMEYPTLITAGTRWWAGRDQNPEAVIIHEYGHQYWYGLVATNEFEEPWLDEGFNTYSTGKVLGTAYGADVIPLTFWSVPLFYLPFQLPHPIEDRVFTLQGKFNDPILRPSWQYYDSTSYAINSYPRTGLVMNTLERYLGEEVMSRLMRYYHQRWRFGHPTSEDFFALAEEVTGQDLAWFFDQFVRTSAVLDYELADMRSTEQSAAAGVFDENGQRREVKEGEAEPGTEGARYLTEVTARRLGEAFFPVDLRITLADGKRIFIRPVAIHEDAIEYRIENSADGSVTRDIWPLAERWKRFRFITAAEVHSALIDPERRVLLDANLTNNGRAKTTGLRGAVRWSSGLMFWLQALLQGLSFFS